MKYYYDTGSTGNLRFRPFEDSVADKYMKDSFELITNDEADSIQSAVSNNFVFQRKSDGAIVCATSDCDVWDELTQSFVFSESEYVTEKQAKFKSDLANYRWFMTWGTDSATGGADGLPPIAYCAGVPIFSTESAKTRLDLSSNVAIRKGYTDTDTFRFKNVDGTHSDIFTKDMVEWPIMIVESEEVFFEKEETVIGLINELSTKVAVDAFDVKQELDNLVKPILSADLTKYAYPIKYHNEDL